MQSESEMLISRLNNDQLHAFKTIFSRTRRRTAPQYILTRRKQKTKVYRPPYGGQKHAYKYRSIKGSKNKLLKSS
jgi:hypothetical protein